MGTGRGDTYKLGALQSEYDEMLERWESAQNTARIWDRDPAVWTNSGEDAWLGWLDAVETHRSSVPVIQDLSNALKADGITDVLLLGMGGSSLCPEVVAETFGDQPGFPKLSVLDSTVPDQVRRFRAQIDIEKTVVSVASKSGSTVEPNVLLDYFTEELARAGVDVGRHIIAVTDPGSSLEARAKEGGYLSVMHGVPEIGGRFSALSNFGLLPAGLAGVDLERYLGRAGDLVDACRSDADNPGVRLGAALGAAQSAGRDKLTLVVSPQLWDIGAWIEQLVAESTGKVGVGICPIDQEPVLDPSLYGNDRLFVQIRLEGDDNAHQDAQIEALASAGHPVVSLSLSDVYDLGAEFYRWEFATAVVGSLMGINPFDQPNVQESKDITSELLGAYEADGVLPEPEAVGLLESLEVTATETASTPEETIAQVVSSLAQSDYFTISAYCDRTALAQETFQGIRKAVAESGVATTLGYGPRFLHSTGQLHKGGSNSGVFLQITTAPTEDLAIPGKAATFGVLSRAQALGDYRALVEKGRRVVRLDLTEGLEIGLPSVERAILNALN